MANLVIVAIPSESDYVWKLSSEKVPHCTLVFMGDAVANPNVSKIQQFLEHAVNILELGPFGLEVDRRGELGPDKADVIFFRDDWSLKRVKEFRGQLLKNEPIRNAYENAPQHDLYPDGWTPHLTMGYPAKPAKEDKRDYPGTRWVEFDKIALWYGNYEGPEWQLRYNYDLAEVGMSAQAGKEFISHYGVKGMKWGQRKQRDHSGKGERKRPGVQKFLDPQGHSLRSDVVKSAAGLIIPFVGIPANVRIGRAAGRTVQSRNVHRKEQKFIKGAHSPQNFVHIHNGAVPGVTKRVGELNKKQTLPMNPAQQAAYDKKVLQIMQQEYQKSARQLGNKTGTLHLEVKFPNPKTDEFKIVAKPGRQDLTPHKVKHAATDSAENTFSGKVIRDDQGLIVSLEFDDFDTLKHTAEIGAAFIAHHGVKGMKWGQRKARSAPVARAPEARSVVRRAASSKTKIKTGGGHNHPATEDAIKAALSRQKLRKSGHHALSNKELQELANRLNLESQVTALIRKQPKSPARAAVTAVLKDPAKSSRRVQETAQAGKDLVSVGKVGHRVVKRKLASRR